MWRGRNYSAEKRSIWAPNTFLLTTKTQRQQPFSDAVVLRATSPLRLRSNVSYHPSPHEWFGQDWGNTWGRCIIHGALLDANWAALHSQIQREAAAEMICWSRGQAPGLELNKTECVTSAANISVRSLEGWVVYLCACVWVHMFICAALAT